MTKQVYDYDWQSIYPSIVKPMCGRGSGKSQAQLQMYDAILKGENKMGIKATLNKIYGKSAATNAVIKDDITQEDITNAIKTLEEEEWIWVKGFKGTEKDMSCKGYRYELGKQFDLDDGSEPLLCEKGFHFCKKLENVFRYYSIGDGNRFFEVEALVKKSDWGPEQKKNNTCKLYQPYSYLPGFIVSDDKYSAKSIRFVRELAVDEVFGALGTGCDVREWADEQKKRAMETSISAVRKEVREFELCAAGYSPAFSKYIAGGKPKEMKKEEVEESHNEIEEFESFDDSTDGPERIEIGEMEPVEETIEDSIDILIPYHVSASFVVDAEDIDKAFEKFKLVTIPKGKVRIRFEVEAV